uniref:Glutamate--tRNA ligase n=1 Tax=Anthurium amnicola TaxID=1678845 RepID=A0A1D1XJ85_9ARAE
MWNYQEVMTSGCRLLSVQWWELAHCLDFISSWATKAPSKTEVESVCKIFQCVGNLVRERGFVPKRIKINYESLAQGALTEMRHVFARVVFDTVYPQSLEQTDCSSAV